MDEILELATKLGKRIAQDPRAVAMADAKEALDSSPVDRELLADYEHQQHKLHTLEMGGKPIEPEDKRRLAELHEKVVSSEAIKLLIKAQANYVELMTQVTRRVEEYAMG